MMMHENISKRYHEMHDQHISSDKTRSQLETEPPSVHLSVAGQKVMLLHMVHTHIFHNKSLVENMMFYV